MKKESNVGAIAGHDGTFNNKEDEEKSVIRRKIKTSVSKKNMKKQIDDAVRNAIYDVMLEQENQDAVKSTMDLMDNVSKQLSLSCNYVKMFLSDGLKLGGEAIKGNVGRAKAEVKRINKLSQDLYVLIEKVVNTHQQEEIAKENALKQEKINQKRLAQQSKKPAIEK